MINGIPLPARDGPFEEGFWAALDRGVLAHQHCEACATWHFPPRWRCHCGGALTYQEVSGAGTLWSWTEVHPPVLPAFAPFAPYVVGLVQLDEGEGLRMVGNLVVASGDPINRVRPEQLQIGMKVQAVIGEIADGIPWPSWKIEPSIPTGEMP
ncbi:MAG: OB-fold domain-containing protein [Sphingomonadaceae bacterium]|nr:OB-fold domain-containing protein [Sphingomonadaceae bacterium]